MKTITFGLLALATAVAAHAGDAQPGTLSQPHFMSDGTVIVYTDGIRSNVPSCATGQPSRFTLNATTAQGKIQLSGLLTAFAAGKPVSIVGTGSCVTLGSEAIDYFYIAD